MLTACSTTADPITQLGLTPTALRFDATTDQNTAETPQGLAAILENDDATPQPTARPEIAADTTQAGPGTPGQAASDPAQQDLPETATASAGPPSTASETTASSDSEVVAADQRPAADSIEDTDTVAALSETKPAPAKKRGFLSSFFAARATPAAAAAAALTEPTQKQVVEASDNTADDDKSALSAKAGAAQPVAASLGGDVLPGVRSNDGLFEISRKSGHGNDDLDLYEEEEEPEYKLASAAGMARLAPNGLLKQRDSVDTACLKPALVHMLKSIERHYGKRMVVTSGYRSPKHNRRVRGARNSLHMYCAAADVQIPGVSKWELARYVRSLRGRGGVGTYCHTKSVHIDVGPERDWNWRCRRRRK